MTGSKPAAASYPRVDVATRAVLRSWLEANHATSTGAWLVTRKKVAGGVLTWNDIVEEALCFGWVDSLPRKVDDERSMLLVTPRRATSKWSAKNKAHVEDLERRGRMHASGRAVVEQARRSGTWSALDEVSALHEPPDLVAALAALPHARRHWDAFPPSARRGILEWIAAAKRAPTRGARVEATAKSADQGLRANAWPRPKT